jgi:beta-galactosidase
MIFSINILDFKAVSFGNGQITVSSLKIKTESSIMPMEEILEMFQMMETLSWMVRPDIFFLSRSEMNCFTTGLCHSDHTPTPGLLEYKKVIEPIKVHNVRFDGRNLLLEIENRYDFLALDHLESSFNIFGDGWRQEFMTFKLGKLLPTQRQQIAVTMETEANITGKGGETWIEIQWRLKEDKEWAKKGHLVAWHQALVKQEPRTQFGTLKSGGISAAMNENDTSLEIYTAENHFVFSLDKGHLSSWIKGGERMLSSPPQLDFYRPTTDNDRPADGVEWVQKHLDKTKNHVISSSWSFPEDGKIQVEVIGRIAPPVYEWAVNTKTIYLFDNSGVTIDVKGDMSGFNLPQTFARLGYTFKIPKQFETASWFGRGPGETYRDSRGQRLGNYTSSIDGLWTEYEFPQENGNRMDVRRVSFETAEGVKLQATFDGKEGRSFSASHFECMDIERARHPYDLLDKKLEEVVVRLDFDHHGLGTGEQSCYCCPLNKLIRANSHSELWTENVTTLCVISQTL